MATKTANLDVVIPIVFPNYQIKVAEPVVIPGFQLPQFSVGGHSFGGQKVTKTEVFDGKIADLGHAGVLFIRGGGKGGKGLTKYYEYGRYDPKEFGVVRPVGLPDVNLEDDGRASKASLIKVLAVIASKGGHGTRIAGAYIEAPGKFADFHTYAEFRQSLNNVPTRDKYSIWSYSCLHFMRSTAEKSGKPMPSVVDPTPSAYIERVRAVYPDLDYDPKTGELKIEDAEGVPDWARAGAPSASPRSAGKVVK